MSLFFKGLIHQGSALCFFDDIQLKLNSKPPKRQLIKQLHDIGTKENPKLAHKNLFFMLPTV